VDKDGLRRILSKRLSSLSYDELHSLRFKLTNQLIKFFLLHPEFSGHVGGVYLPFKTEIAPSYQELIKKVPMDLAFPVLIDGAMSFGIPQAAPQGFAWLDVPFELATPQWFLVPGIGFDFNGARLGRGKGYYDRYLENKKVLKVGVAWTQQIIEKIPVDQHDCHMDFIITEDFCWDVSQQEKF
jgi:5,10-methenyltetrahydrofolate synthetase